MSKLVRTAIETAKDLNLDITTLREIESLSLSEVMPFAQEKALPFEPLVPNAKTIHAIKAARRGRFTAVDSVDHLVNSLNTDDTCHNCS